MRCEEFKNLLIQFGNADHAAVKLHTANCKQCAAHLSDEQVLNVGLQALADSTAQAKAAAAIKLELLTAFREQHKTFTAPERLSILALIRGWRWNLAPATTAAILLGLAVVSIFWFRAEPIKIATKDTPVFPAPTTPVTNEAEKQSDITVPSQQQEQASLKKISAKPQRALRSKLQFEAKKMRQETATEFIPLTYATDTKALQNRTMMRIEVPRTTLIAMGLPLSERRTNEIIKAEVMMGDDGVAYAIRLLQ